MLLPVDMREWLPWDDLVFVVLDAVAMADLGEFRRQYRPMGALSLVVMLPAATSAT